VIVVALGGQFTPQSQHPREGDGREQACTGRENDPPFPFCRHPGQSS
jgi:hypothetical protein